MTTPAQREQALIVTTECDHCYDPEQAVACWSCVTQALADAVEREREALGALIKRLVAKLILLDEYHAHTGDCRACDSGPLPCEFADDLWFAVNRAETTTNLLVAAAALRPRAGEDDVRHDEKCEYVSKTWSYKDVVSEHLRACGCAARATEAGPPVVHLPPCTHDALEREIAVAADGLCPLCLHVAVSGMNNLLAEIERLERAALTGEQERVPAPDEAKTVAGRYYVEKSDDAEDADAPWLVVDREGGKGEGYPRESRVLAMCYSESYATRVCDAMIQRASAEGKEQIG